MVVGTITALTVNTHKDLQFRSIDTQNDGWFIDDNDAGNHVVLSDDFAVTKTGTSYTGTETGVPWYNEQHYHRKSFALPSSENGRIIDFYQSYIDGTNYVIFCDGTSGLNIASITVPTNHNYELDMTISDDGVVIYTTEQGTKKIAMWFEWTGMGAWAECSPETGQALVSPSLSLKVKMGEDTPSTTHPQAVNKTQAPAQQKYAIPR